MLIKFTDYKRIFQIISAVVDSEKADREHSCIYYSLFAANILVEHFKVDARVKCGLAVYHLGDDDQVLCFGEAIGGKVTATPAGFHCWVEVDGWLLDFMAPTFCGLKKTSFTLQPRMFQKRHSDMADHPNDMVGPGDFFLDHDQEIADTILKPVCERLGVQDLAHLCSQWFKKVPKKIPSTAATVDQNGKTRPLSLRPVSLTADW